VPAAGRTSRQAGRLLAPSVRSRGTIRPAPAFRSRTPPSPADEPDGKEGNTRMNSVIYLVGLVVIVLAILSFVGLA